MRIMIVNWSIRRVAGTEDYLNNLIPELRDRGHELAFAHEVDLPQSRERILLPEGTPSWDVSQSGIQTTLRFMKDWKPDLIYAHGDLDPGFEDGFLGIAPAVYFAHNYYGTCIGGHKTFKFPIVQPCSRRFGPACMAQYFPRRCGGRSPLTMVKLYLRQSRRLVNMAKYEAIVTHSNHMREEYIRHGLPESKVHNFLYEIGPRPRPASCANEDATTSSSSRDGSKRFQLLFVGRMELLKGGATLLDAIRLVASRVGGIRLVLAGDGPRRREWERKAARLQRDHPNVECAFAGWMNKDQLEFLYTGTDLLVVPSLWPEPFGRIGPEAGLRGVPVAAFAVGGITDWLIDGVNGFLASGNPPTAAGLAEAIVKCLESPAGYARLRTGASKIASQFNMHRHMEALQTVFETVRCNSQADSTVAAAS